MSAWRRSGAAVLLLAVMCATAGSAAAQQQSYAASRTQFRRTLEDIVRDDKLSNLESRLDALVSKLESRVDTLDSRLVLFDSRVDELTIQLVKNSQNPQADELSSRLESQQSQLDELDTKLNRQTSQLDEVVTKVNSTESQLHELVVKVNSHTSQLDVETAKVNNQVSRLDTLTTLLGSQESRLDTLTTRLGSQESQVTGLMTVLDSQQSQLAVLTNTSNSDRSRLDGAINKTVSQQTHIDELAVRLEQVEVERERVKPPPRDCSQLPAGATSGVYLLKPSLDTNQQAVNSFCDMDTNGGSWTVFQRRNETGPHQDFYLGWAAYKQGFGDLTGEFWWGLEHLHQMTSKQDRKYELRIELEDFDGNQAYAMYQDFRISSEADGYMLSVSNYTGDAGDSLSYNANPKFSTLDRDQDGVSRHHCAQLFKAAWWYGAGREWSWCGYSSLNGRSLGRGGNDETGIWWYQWRRYRSLKKTEMKIRPI